MFVATTTYSTDQVEKRTTPGQLDKFGRERNNELYVRRSPPIPMSLRSLEMCTESLGSETGSDDYYSSDAADNRSWSYSPSEKERAVSDDAVKYRSFVSRKSPRPPFPPPLSSISRHDGPCVRMRPHRKDGRLVVEAVAVPSQNYLRAERQDGRLLLSFVNPSARRSPTNAPEEVEAVSVQPQHQSSSTPPSSHCDDRENDDRSITVRPVDSDRPCADAMRSSQLRKPLFIWEASCIATSPLIR